MLLKIYKDNEEKILTLNGTKERFLELLENSKNEGLYLFDGKTLIYLNLKNIDYFTAD